MAWLTAPAVEWLAAPVEEGWWKSRSETQQSTSPAAAAARGSGRNNAGSRGPPMSHELATESLAASEPYNTLGRSWKWIKVMTSSPWRTGRGR